MTSRPAPGPQPPTPPEFGVILSGGEGQFVEFKESASDSLARELVAMANSGGGRVYVGVADDRSVKGVQTSNRLLSQIQDIARGCDPPIRVHVTPFAYKGQEVVMIDVPDGNRKPHGCSAGYFLRTGPNSQKMSREELVEFVGARVQIAFDRADCPEFRYPADFDGAAFQTYMRRVGLTSAGLKREAVLENLGLAHAKDGVLRLNHAGVLFFAKEPRRFLPHAEVTCVLYRDREGVDIIDRKDFRGNLRSNLEDIEAFLKRHISVRYEIRGLRRKEIPELPEEVLREAVVNAVMHRDYRISGARVMVKVLPDRVEVSNPGGLPPGLDPRHFGSVSVHRNELIADLLHRLGVGERVGSGIARMRQSMRAAGLPAPKFEFDTFFVATFRKKAAVDLGATAGTKSALSRHQVEILTLCRQPRAQMDLMKALQRSDRTKFRKTLLDPLLQAGLLTLTIPDKPRSRFQKYVATEAGRKELKEVRP